MSPIQLMRTSPASATAYAPRPPRGAYEGQFATGRANDVPRMQQCALGLQRFVQRDHDAQADCIRRGLGELD